MGAFTETTMAPQYPTGTANDMAISQQQPPPAYTSDAPKGAAQTGTPGQPRTDDPARAEVTYNSNQPPAMVTPRESLRYDPAWVDCPFCHQRTLTNVRKVESDTTWIYTLLCCVFCGCLGAIFPLIFGWGNDSDHYCKTCSNRVARVPHEGASNTMVQVFGPQQSALVQQVPVQQQLQVPAKPM